MKKQQEECGRKLVPRVKRAVEANDLLLNQRKSSLGRLHSEIDDLSGQLQNPYLPKQEREKIQAKRNQLENKAFEDQFI